MSTQSFLAQVRERLSSVGRVLRLIQSMELLNFRDDGWWQQYRNGYSQAATDFSQDFAKLLEIVACYEAALEKVWFGDNPKTERVDLDFGAVRSLYTARELSEIAHEALKAADKIAGGGE